MSISIYALVDPITNATRYVGQSVDPEKRYVQHLQLRGFQGNVEKLRWIEHLYRAHKRPLLKILEECATPSEANDAERRWIRKMILDNNKLLNISDGGNCRSHTRVLHATPDEWIEFGNAIKRARKELSAAMSHAQNIIGKSAAEKIIKIEKQLDSVKADFENVLFSKIDCGDFRQKVFFGDEIAIEETEGANA